MDTTLVIVTILSMGMAAALSAIVWRLLRDERHRSEARIAALTEASRLGPAVPAQRAAVPATAILPPKGGSHGEDAVASPVRRKPEDPVRRNGADDLPLHTAGAPVRTGALFAEPDRSSPWGNRMAVMAGLAMVGAAVVLVALAAAKTRATPAAPAAAAAAPATPAVAAPGLELLSLRDAKDADALTITGMVQNPRTGSVLSRVAVTAYAFDDKGAFLASGRALLDVTSLAPGDESPFLVRVPVTGTVARYRIGFRSEDGRVIAHVDKRQQPPMAALRQPNG
jgi:hypothetical protein